MLAIRFHQKSDILKEKVQKKGVISSTISLFFDRIDKNVRGKTWENYKQQNGKNVRVDFRC